RAVLQDEARVDPVSVVSAERLVVRSRFAGSRTRYLAALRKARMTLADARALIADEIARDRIQSTFKPRARPRSELDAFLARYAALPVREVAVEPAAPWLGGATRGWAVSTLAPEQVFRLRGKARIDTADG